MEVTSVPSINLRVFPRGMNKVLESMHYVESPLDSDNNASAQRANDYYAAVRSDKSNGYHWQLEAYSPLPICIYTIVLTALIIFSTSVNRERKPHESYPKGIDMSNGTTNNNI
jgi:hypothetical protein